MDAQRKQAIQGIFDTVAPGYDHPALAFFPATAERMLAQLQLDPDARLLDVCTGTGRVSLRAARLLEHGHVVGIDLSGGMLEQARGKAREAALNNITFQQMDMEALTFAPRSFDAATCSFGLFFVDDMEQALRNIAACIKPGGQIAISSFAEGAFEPMSSLFLRRCETFGLETHPASWLRIATEPALHTLFAAAELAPPTVYHVPLRYSLSAENWWAIVWNAGYRGYLQRLPEAEQLAFRQQHLAEIAALVAGGQDAFSVDVMIAVARHR
jgi:ubiquinone/menaquinone biosynthesis C-methylase UbiE